MIRISQISTVLISGALLAACSAPARPPQSPTNDNQPPATSPGDGKIIGADNVSPAQKLEEGPTLSGDGVKPAATPPAE